MIYTEFGEKVEELSKKYGVVHGKVYDLMTLIETALKIKCPDEFLFNRNAFYRKTYFITNHRLRLRQQAVPSELENISNLAYNNKKL